MVLLEMKQVRKVYQQGKIEVPVSYPYRRRSMSQWQ